MNTPMAETEMIIQVLSIPLPIIYFLLKSIIKKLEVNHHQQFLLL